MFMLRVQDIDPCKKALIDDSGAWFKNELVLLVSPTYSDPLTSKHD